ncbi:MATH domain and coiled-coil domain-containing protein At3g58250-like isoform X2 [Phaseolus vulgaris]|uniref:MATH domain and coiled-coil domain-containing protein At3g58250-like isoform X2 n=1 Tax=Phaseolus vulgaris TaxID=3885 RepID=UPI0035CB2D29
MGNNKKRLKLMFEKYTWNITNFSKVFSFQLFSDKFILDGQTWQIVITPIGSMDDYIDIYLEADKDCANVPEGWKKAANFSFAVTDQVNDKMTIRKGFEFEYSANDYSWGIDDFLPLQELKNPGSGFIVNDTCVIEAGIFFTKYVDENSEYQPVCKIDDNPTRDRNNPLFHKMFRSSYENVDQKFVPLLVEACLQHPSLVVSQEKRSCRFTEWAFSALGRVLHFLKTKTVKDIDDEACNHLQILWDELKTFGFDLTWLEFYVESALGAKDYMENIDEMRKNVSALKIETEKLKARLIERETKLEMSSKELMKAEKICENSIWMSKSGY